MRSLTTALLTLTCLALGLVAPDGLSPADAAEHSWCVVEGAFPTAEYSLETQVKIDGEGSLRLVYDGDGRTAVRTIVGPTEGWQPVSLHMRANPRSTRDRTGQQDLFLRAIEEPVEPACKIALDDFTVTPLYQHEPPKIDTPPVIDGDLSDACWNDASYTEDPYWGMYNLPGDAKAATHVWCAYDDEHLYVAFRCMTPRPDDLVDKVVKHDGPAWRDDSAEIFFNPSHDHQEYYEYIVTPKEVVFDSKWFREGGVYQTDWHYFGDWKVAIEEDAWTVEIALDLRSYEERDLRGNPTGYMPLPTGDVAGILFSRNDRVLAEGMSWSDCKPGFHQVHQYGHLVGFEPNYVDGYRKFALRAIDELDARWSSMYIRADRPALVPSSRYGIDDGTEGVAEALASLRSRAEADRPDFDEWVAIGEQIERMDKWLDRAETVLAWDTLREQPRPYPAECGVAVASPFDFTEVRTAYGLPETLHVPDVIEVSAARGEYEPICLYLLPLGDEPITVAVPTRFATRHGVDLPVSFLWYEVVSGHLLPVSQVVLEPGKPKQVWCLLEVPREMDPGKYDCRLARGSWAWLPGLKLTVRDFELPLTPSLPVAASFQNVHVTEAGENVFAISPDKYWRAADQLLRHRITPAEMLADFTRWQGDKPDFALADQALARAETFGVNPKALMLANESQLMNMTDPVRKLDIARRHWRRRLGERLAPVFVSDYPRDPVALSPRMLEQSLISGLTWDGKPRTESEHFGTWAVPPRVATGSLDRWEDDLAILRSLITEHEPRLAWDLGPSGVWEARMMGWLAFKYKPPLLVYPKAFFFDHPPSGWTASGLLHAGPGGGMYFIPGSPEYDPPVPTMYIEMLRDGLEDYEYLRLLSRLNSRLGRVGGASENTRLYRENSWIFRRHDELMESAVSYTNDPEVLMRWRDRVATQIERTRAALRVHGEEGLPGDGGE